MEVGDEGGAAAEALDVGSWVPDAACGSCHRGLVGMLCWIDFRIFLAELNGQKGLWGGFALEASRALASV